MDCKTLHEIIRKGKRFNFNNDKSTIPSNGVCIMFEKNEIAHGGERIVYIGINEKLDRLPKRINNHYKGTTRKSIFRKHIGTCLVNGAEQDISAYMQANISFAIIEVNDKVQRKELKKRIIATISQCQNCKPSAMWLGRKCSSVKIARGKLWNVLYLNSTPLNVNYDQLICEGLMY